MTTTDIVPVERAPVTVFGTDSPVEIVARVTAIAKPLADFIQQSVSSQSQSLGTGSASQPITF